MKDIIVKSNITIRQAMKVLEKVTEKCLLVVDKNRKLLGTLTDGDLRRSILAGTRLSDDISGSFHPNPVTLIKDKFTSGEARL